jgi:hypothetical protein
MFQFTCNGTDVGTAIARELQVAQKLIEVRAARLKTSVRDATIAMAMNVLQSLRAETREATKTKIKPTIKLRSDLYPSFHHKRRCLRIGSPHGPCFDGMPIYWNGDFGGLDKHKKISRLKVYEIKSQHEARKPYLVVASTPHRAEDVERMRGMREIARYGGLARAAFTIALSALGTDSKSPISQFRGVGRISQGSRTIVDARRIEGFNSISFIFHDKLDYAELALKHGAGSINLAIQRASNKTVGYLNKIARQNLKQTQLPIPFPEICG